MAGGAIFADTKSGVTIMTGTTRLTGFHRLHTHLVTVGLGPEGLRLTFIATEHFGMGYMAEDNPTHRALYRNIFRVSEITLMAGGTIFADTKSGITIVTGTARLTGFHTLHPHLGTIGFGDKNIWVTI
jgi:hypothetical protein